MSNKETMFWKLVEEIGWGTETTDREKISRILRLKYDEKYLVTMKKFAIQKRKELAVIMDDFDIKKTGKAHSYWNVSDDSFWDLTAHIVGLGKEMYDFIYANPVYAKAIKYKENFEYCFNLYKYEKNIGSSILVETEPAASPVSPQ